MLSGFTSWTSPGLPRRRKNCTSLANSPGEAFISPAGRRKASPGELAKLEFAWRSLHIAGRAQVDVLVSNGARRIALVALRERGAIRVGEPEIADSDLQRRKNPLLDKIGRAHV